MNLPAPRPPGTCKNESGGSQRASPFLLLPDRFERGPLRDPLIPEEDHYHVRSLSSFEELSSHGPHDLLPRNRNSGVLCRMRHSAPPGF